VASITERRSLRRRRRPSLNNEQFLDKALDMFLKHGFGGASIDAITAAAGIAKRTVYLRYGDKKSLFKAALRRAIEEWIVPIERLREVECANLEDSLLAIGQILVHNMLSPAGLRLLHLTNAESARMPEIGVFNIHQGSERTIAYLADLFRRHLEGSGAFPEAEDAAEAFLHLIVGGPANAAAWGVRRTKAAIDKRIRYSVRLFLHGLLAPSENMSVDPIAPLKHQNRQLQILLSETLAQLDIATERIRCSTEK